MTKHSNASLAAKAAAILLERAGAHNPKTVILLGSGLGGLAESIDNPIIVPYDDLPGFPELGVPGHVAAVSIGTVDGVPLLLLRGRTHYYEHGRVDGMKDAIQALAAMGCETLIATNAAGSLRPDVTPGSLLLLSDHINFTGMSPLFGESGDARFVDMTGAYDPALRQLFHRTAENVGIPLPEGVYFWASGPQFETPAEIRAARALGADAVGMSTAPEVILARYAGLRVAGLSIITNMAAGLDARPLAHEETLKGAALSAAEAQRLLFAVVAELAADTGGH